MEEDLESVIKLNWCAGPMRVDNFSLKPKIKKKLIGNQRGIFTWPIQDDRMNMTKKVELDQKIHTDD